jgi:hypothetical protein
MPDRRPDSTRILGERIFSDADQQRFAAESRDFNPIHVDPVAARRLISGRQVVHGVHTLIQALDLWPASTGEGPGHWAVRCNFVHPVSMGDRVAFAALPDWHGQHRVVAMVDGVAATDIVLGDASASASDRAKTVAPVDWAVPRRRLGALTVPLDEPAESFVDQCIEIEPWPDSLAALYPRAAARLGAPALTDLARLSFVVGMICPGLHSVFLSLQFNAVAAAAVEPLLVKVLRYDPRYRLFVVAFRGALQGELRAVRRPPPQAQPRAAELAGQVAGVGWAGRRALVVGGSRGLGETMAKLLAVAGCDVTITHASGRDDALAVADDIRALGRGRCDTVALDLSRPFAPPPGLAPGNLDAVFYFATPRIHAKRSAVFHRAAFDELAGFYLDRFQELCLWLEGGGQPVLVYLPSTVFITERPKGMTEYAMAKAAAELLADDLNRTLRYVRIVHTRLPRLATDQTALVTQLSVSDNVASLLGVLQAMQPERPGA